MLLSAESLFLFQTKPILYDKSVFHRHIMNLLMHLAKWKWYKCCKCEFCVAYGKIRLRGVLQECGMASVESRLTVVL